MADSIDLRVKCCIVGGGPAGMMLGCLLARAGVPVLVLEKHADFLRDFRGDTIHPSTMQLLDELGVLEEFLKLPHQQISKLKLDLNGHIVDGPDFSHLPTKCKFVALAPQWEFLNFMQAFGSRYSTFQLMMNADVTGYWTVEGRVAGVHVQTPSGPMKVAADLVVAADGRGSILRAQSQLPVLDLGAPIDVLWYRLPKPRNIHGEQVLGHIGNRRMLVTLDRGDYLQCATVIPKGHFELVKKEGLETFRQNIITLVPELQEEAPTLQSWDQVKLLTVQVNRLEKWFLPGLLFIGDAAHAMSPVGGIGINIAIQDAVATANLLAEKLRTGEVTPADLERVQDRREWPTRLTQNFQIFAHRRIFDAKRGFGQTLLFSDAARQVLGLIAPVIRRSMARVLGMGFRPEHIETEELRVES